MRFIFRLFVLAGLLYAGRWLWHTKESKLSSLLSYYLNCDVCIRHVEIKSWHHLVLHDLQLCTSTQQPAFYAESVGIKFQWKDCLKRPFPIQELTILEPELCVQILDRSAERSNWSVLLGSALPSSLPLTIDTVYIAPSQIRVGRPSHKEVCFTMKAMNLTHIGGHYGLSVGQTARVVFCSILDHLTHQPPLHHLLDAITLPKHSSQPPIKNSKSSPSPAPQQIQHMRRHVNNIFS